MTAFCSNSRVLAPAFFSATIWWLIPLILRIYPRSDEDQGLSSLFSLAMLALVASAAFCAANRTKEWCVLFWMPPAVIGGTACIFGISLIIQEAATKRGNMAPLAGVALLWGIGALAILLGTTLLLLFFRPKRFPLSLTIVAVCNSIAIGFAASQTDYQANKQELTIHILDIDGHPVQGATLRYERVGYGPGGRDIPAGTGTPILSDAHGIVRPHLRSMRHKLTGTIQHPNYQKVSFTAGMQYSTSDRTRTFSFGTEKQPRTAYGFISIEEPLSAYIYLPPRYGMEGHNQMVNKKASTTLIVGAEAKSCLNLKEGGFVSPPEGDLRFELYVEPDGQYIRPRMRIHALNGTGIQMLPPYISFSGPIQFPERLFEIAPRDGYSEQITIMEPGNSPGPKIFVSTRNRTVFYMLTVDLYTDRTAKTGRCFVEIVTNLAYTENSESK